MINLVEIDHFNRLEIEAIESPGKPGTMDQLNGKRSCLWASEIEEFPMAVTRKRFGGKL